MYNIKQKENVSDVAVNQELSTEQTNDAKSLLQEYNEIFTDVPKVTDLAKHKVELTHNEPMQSKIYQTPYKMEEVISKEIDDMLAMGIIEHSEAAYASPIILVKKPDERVEHVWIWRNWIRSQLLTLSQWCRQIISSQN